ncbi:MAG: hypothetical protein H0X41_04180 [Chitinophagaceae bacterium]|nr:hypothetical protein [Chitinophagaceae bacterium]
MFSLRSGVILLLVLFIPLLLKYLGEEPYPAVLLPANAETFKKNEYLTVMNTCLFGVGRDGSWEEIDKRVFFDPIPLEHARTILADNLELEGKRIRPETKKSEFYRKLGIFQRQALTATDWRQLKDWIKIKLARQGFSTISIRVVVYNNTVAIKSGLVINKEIKNEKIYLLN